MINLNINEAKIIYQNDHVNIITEACKLCYKSDTSKMTYLDKLKYIQSKVKAGHESVLEHSNIVVLMKLNSNNLNDYMKVLEANEFLKIHSVSASNMVKTEKRNKSFNPFNRKKILYSQEKFKVEETIVLISGSIRGYKELFRRISGEYNGCVQMILNSLYTLPREYFYDFIEDGIMKSNMFDYIDDELINENEKTNPTIQFDGCEIIAHDILTNNIFSELLKYGFTLNNIIDCITVTIYFNSVSRVLSHQLVRHRNAISQKSQRYCDETNSYLINPAYFKQDSYDDKVYEFDGMKFKKDRKKVAYSGLYIEAKRQGFVKEDARYLLPNGVETELYVTFSLRNLLYFLQLRTDKHAQAEIQYIAKQIEEFVDREIFISLNKDYKYRYIIPRYKLHLTNDEDIDEVLEESVQEL